MLLNSTVSGLFYVYHHCHRCLDEDGFTAHTHTKHFENWERFASTDPFLQPPEVVFFEEYVQKCNLNLCTSRCSITTLISILMGSPYFADRAMYAMTCLDDVIHINRYTIVANNIIAYESDRTSIPLLCDWKRRLHQTGCKHRALNIIPFLSRQFHKTYIQILVFVLLLTTSTSEFY